MWTPRSTKPARRSARRTRSGTTFCVTGRPSALVSTRTPRRCRRSRSAATRRTVNGTCRTRPPFSAVTWPFHSDRSTRSWRFARSTSLHSSAMISPNRGPASPRLPRRRAPDRRAPRSRARRDPPSTNAGRSDTPPRRAGSSHRTRSTAGVPSRWRGSAQSARRRSTRRPRGRTAGSAPPRRAPDGGALAQRDRPDPAHDIRPVTRGESVSLRCLRGLS